MSYTLFADGFEAYASADDLLKYGYSNAGLPGYGALSNQGRFDSNAIAITSNFFGRGLQRSLAAAAKVVWAGALKLTTGNTCSIQLSNGGDAHAVLSLTANNVASLSAGGAVVATSENTFPADTWMFVELGLSVANSGGTYELRVNGSSAGWIPAVTGDTQTGANATVTAWGVFGTVLIDDMYVTSGDELKWFGDSRFIKLALTGDSTPQDWTPSSGNAWERLNAGDGSVSSNVDEATSLFTLEDLPVSPQTIRAITVRGLMSKSDASNRGACVMIKSDDTESESTELALSTDPLGLTALWETDPDTAAAWVEAGVNALKVGLRVKT